MPFAASGCPSWGRLYERQRHKTMIFDRQQLQKITSQRRESPEIEHFIAQRDQLLKDHPQLMALQEEIDALLGTTLDPVRRLEILFMVMSDKLMEMRSAFSEALRLVHAVADSRGGGS